MDDLESRMKRAAGRDAPALGRSGCARLAVYCQAVITSSLNLTGFTDANRAFETLVLGSLVVGRAWPRRRSPRLSVDAGSGNGFPGVAVASLWPRCNVLLVERRAKKARAIESCLGLASITNAQPLACDLRELERLRPDLPGTVDLVTVRAVGPLGRTTRMVGRLLAPGGRVVHWKAADLDEVERAEGARVARAMGLECPDEIERDGGAGRLVIYERPGEAP